MRRYQYLIGNLIFDVEAEGAFTPAEDTIFRTGVKQAFDLQKKKIQVFCGIDASISVPDNVGCSEIAFYRGKDQYDIYLKDAKNRLSHIIHGDQWFQSVQITSSFAQKLPFEGSAGEVLFRTAILFHHGIVAHAAAINYQGSGIIFSAPSGVGKSTQANLWKRYKGAAVLNGDRPALRVIDGAVYVYGTLWSGTSPDFQNARAPLKAIVMLEQAEHNSVELLPPDRAVQSFLPRCYLPFGLVDLLGRAMDIAGSIIKKVPVLLLKCRPDHQAVELVSQWLNI